MTTVILDLVDSAGRAIAGTIAFTPTYEGIAGAPPYDATPIESDLVDPPETIDLLPSSETGPYEVRARRSFNGSTVFRGLLTIPESGTYSLNSLLNLRQAATAVTRQFVSSVNGLTGDVTLTGVDGVPAEELDVAISNLRRQLEMIGEPLQASSAAGVAALVTLPAPGPERRYVILSCGFSYGGPAAQLAGVFSITEDAGATVRHRDAVTSTGAGPMIKGIRCGVNKAVTITLSGLAGYTANVNGAFRIEDIYNNPV
jgi:hypothetical protein